MQAFQDRATYTDPTITMGSTWAKQIGSVGFLAAGVALRMVTPFLGPITLLAGSVSLIWSSLRKEESVENTYKQKRAKELLCVGALFCIPFVGVLVAGMFAKKRLPHVLDQGIHGGVEALTEIVCYPLSGLIQRAFFPLSHTKMRPVEGLPRQPIVCHIELPGGRSREMEMVLYDNAREERLSRAVVMFPTRYETGISDDAQATEYSQYFDTYKVTLSGYPTQNGLDRSVETTESTCIQDANSAISMLKQIGYTQIAVHGAGLGCVPALAAAELHPDVVKAVVLDRGFTRAKDVLANAVRNRLQPLGLGKWVPTSIFRGMVGAAFAYGMPVEGVSELTTNQMDNLERIRKVAAPIGCIEATQDFWMSRSLLPEPDNLESFSRDLLRAHKSKKDRIRTLDGGHHKALEQGVLVEWLNRVMPIDLEGGKKEPVEHKASKVSAKKKVVAPQNQKSQLVQVEELFFSLPVSNESSSSSSSITTSVASIVPSDSSSSVASSSSSSLSSLFVGSNPLSTSTPSEASVSVLPSDDSLFPSSFPSILSDG